MNLQNHVTKPDKNVQEISDNWNKIIFPHLPENLDKIAKQEGILKRKRGLRSVANLLKVLFLYACSSFSFRILAAASCALGIADISDTAWRKHFSKAAPFLHGILQAMLSALVPAADAPAFEGIKNVLLVDASTVRQEGARQHQQRIHMCYSLNENRMKQVKVTDKYTAESLAHFSIGRGDLVMADAGYGTAKNYIYVQGQGAEAVLRITPENFCLHNADEEKIHLIDMLKGAEKQHFEWVDTFGTCRYGKKSAFVRVIANKLPEGQKKHGREPNTEPQKNNRKSGRIPCSALAGLSLLRPLVLNTAAKK